MCARTRTVSTHAGTQSTDSTYSHTYTRTPTGNTHAQRAHRHLQLTTKLKKTNKTANTPPKAVQSRHEKQFNNQYKSKNECKKQTEKKENKTKEIKQSKTTPNRKPVSWEALLALDLSSLWANKKNTTKTRWVRYCNCCGDKPIEISTVITVSDRKNNNIFP